MAVTTSPRMGVTRWSNSATDPITRAQMDASHASLEALAARDEQGLDLGRPAPALQGRYYFATDATKLYRDSGAAWTQIATIPAANYFTGTVSLNADSVTPAAPSHSAALGVNRNVTGGGVFLSLKNFAAGGSGVDWGIGTYTAGELAAGVAITGAGGWSGPPPFLLNSSGTIRASGTTHYFGGYAGDLTTGAAVMLATLGSTSQVYVAAQGAAATIDTVVRSQGTGGLVWLQPNSDSTKGLKVGTTGSTFLQYVQIAAGGLDVTGSPTGYGSGEVRFPSTSATVAAAITTLATGASVMQFDHRGTGNTGSWSWNNGTSAGSSRMILTSVGILQVTGAQTVPPVTLDPLAGGSTPHGEVTVRGDEADIRFQDGPGTFNRALFGIRNDISGNTTDLVAYVYNGGFVVYPSASATNAFQVRSDGSVRMEVNNSGGIGSHILDVYGSPNSGGWAGINMHSNWGNGAGGDYLRTANAAGDLLRIDSWGRLCWGQQYATITAGSATAGGSSALPGAPAGYLQILINGTTYKLAYWNV
jgi:hypothetical protein